MAYVVEYGIHRRVCGIKLISITSAFGISIGSLFGSPPVTAFIESGIAQWLPLQESILLTAPIGAGISEGGKTGITAVVTALCFFVSGV